jgi:hypothetical protein
MTKAVRLISPVGLPGFPLMLLYLVSGFTTGCIAQNRSAMAAPCAHSDRTYEADASLMQEREAPTHFRLMTSRYVSMVQATRGFECAGTASVGFDGHQFLQTGRSDDPGIMEWVPALSRVTRLSLPTTYDTLILFVILSTALIGYAGFWRICPSRRSLRIGATVFLCIAIAEARVADEYLFQIAPLIAGIPWLLFFGFRNKTIALTLTAALLAFCCSWCSLVRSGSLVICITFLLVMFLSRHRLQNPLIPIVLMFLACVPSGLFERSLVKRRDTALAKVGAAATAVNGHPFWHTFYISLGFIPNAEVPEYRDEVARDKVRSIDPTVAYTSARYQAILRQEIWNLFKRRPLLVTGIFSAKLAIVALLALILLYPARKVIFAEPGIIWVDLAFLFSIGISAMNGIVAIPRLAYLLTFLCLTILYTTIKLCR